MIFYFIFFFHRLGADPVRHDNNMEESVLYHKGRTTVTLHSCNDFTLPLNLRLPSKKNNLNLALFFTI